MAELQNFNVDVTPIHLQSLPSFTETFLGKAGHVPPDVPPLEQTLSHWVTQIQFEISVVLPFRGLLEPKKDRSRRLFEETNGGRLQILHCGRLWKRKFPNLKKRDVRPSV